LLDWTTSPLIALYFAVEGSAVTETGVVHVYDAPKSYEIAPDAGALQIGSLDYIGHFRPTSHSQRIVAQVGWHTIHPTMNVDLDAVQMPGTERPDSQFVGVWKSIKLELRQMVVRAATVYGDLGSVCREIGEDFSSELHNIQCFKRVQDAFRIAHETSEAQNRFTPKGATGADGPVGK
jgi:hypothetical protein